jgi:ribose transport system substrate-binding protein
MSNGCPIGSSQAWQIGLLRCAEKLAAATGCPIAVEELAQIKPLPQRGADQREKPGEAVAPTGSGKRRSATAGKPAAPSTSGQDRHSGFLEGIAGSDIKVIFSADMKWLEPNARKEMESALSRFDRIDLVYAHNDPGAHGAYLAANAAGREKNMKFVGIDALPQEGVGYVRQGIIDVTFQYPTGGAEAIDTALEFLHGQKVPHEITLGTRIFTKTNVAQGGEPLE